MKQLVSNAARITKSLHDAHTWQAGGDWDDPHVRHARRRILKWMLAGGGAAIARFFAGPLASAAPSAREQAASDAV